MDEIFSIVMRDFARAFFASLIKHTTTSHLLSLGQETREREEEK